MRYKFVIMGLNTIKTKGKGITRMRFIPANNPAPSAQVFTTNGRPIMRLEEDNGIFYIPTDDNWTVSGDVIECDSAIDLGEHPGKTTPMPLHVLLTLKNKLINIRK